MWGGGQRGQVTGLWVCICLLCSGLICEVGLLGGAPQRLHGECRGALAASLSSLPEGALGQSGLAVLVAVMR